MFFVLDLCNSITMKDPYVSCKIKGNLSLFGLFFQTCMLYQLYNMIIVINSLMHNVRYCFCPKMLVIDHRI